MKFTLTFADGVAYTSPDIRERDPGWASEDGAKRVGIREMILRMPRGIALILKGFEAYNFFVEASQALGGRGANIDAFCFCGRWRGTVLSWRIDIKTGKASKQISQYGKEYFGTSTRGWRMGLMGEKAESGIFKIKEVTK